MSNNLHSNWCSFERGDGGCDCGASWRGVPAPRPAEFKRQAKVYIRKGYGIYYIRNGLVRFRATNPKAHWINAAHTKEELESKALSGRVIGPIIMNNFQEIES